MRCLTDISGALRALGDWTAAADPALGPLSPEIKTAALAVGAAVVLSAVYGLLRALAAFLRGARRFWSSVFPAETPGEDADDQSERLEADLASALERVAALVSSGAAEAVSEEEARAEELLRALLKECRECAERAAAAFQAGDRAALDEALNMEAGRIGHLLMDAAVRQRLRIAKKPPGGGFLHAL